MHPEKRANEPLEGARRAVAEAEWDIAFQEFAQADRASLESGDLEAWATAGYLLARPDEAIEILELAHDRCLAEGNPSQAARMGFWIVFLLTEQGDIAKAGGWLAKCDRLLEGLPPSNVAHGYRRAQTAHRLVAVENAYGEGGDLARTAIRIARAAGDPDLLALALSLEGRALIRLGEIEDGLSSLDEAMVGVVSGKASPVVVGTVYCSVIEGCEEVAELDRARQWTWALTKWCERQNGEVPFTAQCRVYRSKILQRGGELKAAQEEAHRALREYEQTPYQLATGRAVYELAEIYRMSGDFEAAKESYRQASDWGIDPQPGLALLRLAEGEVEAAAATMRLRIDQAEDTIERIRLLPAFVEVMLASDDLDAADAAAYELAEHAALYRTAALESHAAYASGAVRLTRGDASGALSDLRRSCEIWLALDVPYETARTRALIAVAYRQLGDAESASLETSAARRQFEELGVIDPDQRARDPVGHGLTDRELEVLLHLTTGATNKAIAEDLYLAVRTVDRHVSNILMKLGVSSRTAAVSYAHEHGLVGSG